MHEYGITENIIKTIMDEAKKLECDKIKSVNIVVGELAGIVDESIQMYFDILSEGTMLEGAELKFKMVKAKLQCGDCDKLFERTSGVFNCIHCGGLGKLTDIGKEFYIESIEV